MFSSSRFILFSRSLHFLLLLPLLAIAFLLGCYEMGDSDIWWHLRGGQWILENGRVPSLDPFTFGSADRRWVDVHWSYEVILALTYRAGGVGGIVLLGAVVGALAFLAVVTARRPDWPMSATVLCWIPALMLFGFRLDPRPEIFSLLYLSFYLAVLWRADERPRLLWLLPFVQVLWSNVQGLFILGPVVLVMYGTARGASLLWRLGRKETVWTEEERRRWKRLGAVALVVILACFVNPYFHRGVWFPFDLFPKVADPNNLYKKYIDELNSPADAVKRDTLRVLGKNWFFLAFYFLLPLLPLSFLYPAAWRAAGSSSRSRWLLALASTIALFFLGTWTLPGDGLPWLNTIGDNIAPICLSSGILAALALRRRHPSAALVAGVAGAFLGALQLWLDVKILGGGRGLLASVTSSEQANVPFVLTGIAVAALALRWGSDLFRVFLAGAFGFLALQALQNWTRFALVAGTVLTWNFSAWVFAMQTARRGQSSGKTPENESPAANTAGSPLLIANLILLAVLAGWIALLVGDRFYIHTGHPRHFAFREEPLAFAHDAARFAGSAGLPDRALVYGLDQTGVYDFHNAPRCKPFMDGRLEMPAQSTFETYVAIEDWLEAKDPRWERAVAKLGDPLVLLGHEGYTRAAAEALLFTHPQWRCIYFDALAALFVPRRRVSEKDFPTVDFAARHFRESTQPCVPNVPRAAARELKALYNLSASLPSTPSHFWHRRVPLLLRALDRSRLALEESDVRADVWISLGNCYRDLNPNANAIFAAPVDDWQSERDLSWAQATYCFRRAVQLQPDNAAAWRFLAMAYSRRRTVEAELAASAQWLRYDAKIRPVQREQVETQQRNFLSRQRPLNPALPLEEAVARLVREGRAKTALERVEAAGQSAWSWPFAERVAALYLHSGRPADARLIWEQARACPAPALRDCRLAAASWVERDYDSALRHFRAAQEKEPDRGEIYWGLATLHAHRGDARSARAACRRGLELTLTPKQRTDLEAWQAFLIPYVEGP